MSITTNLAEFGFREIRKLRDLLDAWVNQGLPDDFYQNEVLAVFNKNSGFVFLSNSDFQVAMMNGDTLESFYCSPYEGKEGFFDTLLAEFPEMNQEDKEWFAEIAKQRGELLPSEEGE